MANSMILFFAMYISININEPLIQKPEMYCFNSVSQDPNDDDAYILLIFLKAFLNSWSSWRTVQATCFSGERTSISVRERLVIQHDT